MSKHADTHDRRATYVREVLRVYRATPGVLGRVRRADRELASRLFDRGVPFYAIENALLVAAARRVLHNAFSTPLTALRSLHYFVPVINEMLERPLGYRELDSLRDQLRAALLR